MRTVRWTVRSVDAEAIAAVQAVQRSTGASLGRIVSEAIRRGLPEATMALQAEYEYRAFAAKLTSH